MSYAPGSCVKLQCNFTTINCLPYSEEKKSSFFTDMLPSFSSVNRNPPRKLFTHWFIQKASVDSLSIIPDQQASQEICV
jgi:hypothetical protein